MGFYNNQGLYTNGPGELPPLTIPKGGNPWAYPGEMPAYQSAIPQKGLNTSRYVDPNQSRAPSPWLQMSLDAQALDQQQTQEGATKKMASETQSAMDRLASTRGLTGGASERLASQGATNAADLWSKIASEGDVTRSNLALQDQENFMNQQARNQQLDAANEQMMFQALMADAQNRNQYNLGGYQSKMGAWAANQTANAQAEAQKKAAEETSGLLGGGGFLGTGLFK